MKYRLWWYFERREAVRNPANCVIGYSNAEGTSQHEAVKSDRAFRVRSGVKQKRPTALLKIKASLGECGPDGIRTRDLLRDRQAF